MTNPKVRPNVTRCSACTISLPAEFVMLSPGIPRPPFSIYPGIETELDKSLLSHYQDVVCSFITVNGACDAENPFLSLIVPQACNDEGTMHALLSLSSAHRYRSEPREDLWTCKEQHRKKASNMLNNDLMYALKRDADVHDGIVAGLILQFELNIIDKDFAGEYRRSYLQAREYLKLRDAKPLHRFAAEYFAFRHMGLSMTSLVRQTGLEGPVFLAPLVHKAFPFFLEELRFAVPETVDHRTYDGVMRKVLGGLFPLISEITSLRDGVRIRRLADQDPYSRLRFFQRGTELEKSLAQWDSKQTYSTELWALAELYREAAFVYLLRTIRDPTPCPILSTRVKRGIGFLESLRNHGKSTDCVLLLPTFILGCAAFAASERNSIEKVMQALAECNNFSNVQPSMQALREMWVLMDQNDTRNWDWETIREGKFDFPIT